MSTPRDMLRWEILKELHYLQLQRVSGAESNIHKRMEYGPTPSWLAKELEEDLSEVSRHISELEKDGLIECHEKDGTMQCNLTEGGLMLIAGCG